MEQPYYETFQEINELGIHVYLYPHLRKIYEKNCLTVFLKKYMAVRFQQSEKIINNLFRRYLCYEDRISGCRITRQRY